MKKLSLALVLVLICSLFTSAMAETFSLSYVRSKTDWYEIADQGSHAFVSSKLTPAELCFHHKYDSTVKYSRTYFDMLVVDYNTASEYPVNRLWLVYNSENGFQNFDSVTFHINGTDYTFTGVGNADRRTVDNGTYRESLVIKFGWDNLTFLSALEKLIPSEFEELDNIKISVTLHGKEDIEIELGGMFIMDFMFFREAMFKTNAVDYLHKADTTPLTVK